MERIVDGGSLGRERGEFATPGSDLAAALAETELPAQPGWYVDPLSDGSKARKFNGTTWTGLTREILPERNGVTDCGEFIFEQVYGVRMPAGFTAGARIRFSFTVDTVTLTDPGKAAFTLPVADLVEVHIWNGPQGRLFDEAGSWVISPALGALAGYNRKRNRDERRGLLAVQLVTMDYFIVLTQRSSMFATTRPLLQTLIDDAQRNASALANLQGAAAPTDQLEGGRNSGTLTSTDSAPITDQPSPLTINCVLLSIVGIETNANEGDEIQLLVTDTQVVLMKPTHVINPTATAMPARQIAAFDRSSIRNVEVTGGKDYRTGGGFFGGGFGLEGAVTGMAISTVLNALTTRHRTEPAIAEIVTSWGHVVVANSDLGVLKLKGMLVALTPEAQASPNVAQPTDDVALLERLAALHRDGVLTDEEFASKKQEILARI